MPKCVASNRAHPATVADMAASDVEDEAGPDRSEPNPLRVSGQTWRYVLRRTMQEFIADQCVDRAGALTFFGVLGIFPAGLAVMAIVGIVGDTDAVRERLLTLIGQVAPPAVADTAELILADVGGAGAADLTLIVSVAVALWSASIYVSAFGRAVNHIYGVPEGRPYWKRKPMQLALTVGLLLLVTLVVAVVVLSGPILRAVGDIVDLGGAAVTTWNLVRWPVLAAAVVLMVAVLYKGTGNLRLPAFRWLSVGAVLAIVMMALASLGFGFYAATVADYNRTFGAFAGVIVFLIWLFLINIALLAGVECNAELERGRQLEAGIAAEERLHLPVRDASGIERADRAAEITVERGAMLRAGRDLSPRPDAPLMLARRWIVTRWRRLFSRR